MQSLSTANGSVPKRDRTCSGCPIVEGAASRSLFLRPLTLDELAALVAVVINDNQRAAFRQRARIILQSSQHEHPDAIAHSERLHPWTVRDWIRRFNRDGVSCLWSVQGAAHSRNRRGGRPRKFSASERQRIVALALTPPWELGESFPRWTSARLRERLVAEGIDASQNHIIRVCVENGVYISQLPKMWRSNAKVEA